MAGGRHGCVDGVGQGGEDAEAMTQENRLSGNQPAVITRTNVGLTKAMQGEAARKTLASQSAAKAGYLNMLAPHVCV